MASPPTAVTKLFISHSSNDDRFVRDLQRVLHGANVDTWTDSRELHGGDPLWSEIQKALDESSAYAVVVSPDAVASSWVRRELEYALKLRQQRGTGNYPVIPLALNQAELGDLEEPFGEEPIYIPVANDPGGIDTALNAILVAMRLRLPADVPDVPQPTEEPLEEFVLQLTDPRIHEEDGVRRASALARLVYEPATPGQTGVQSVKSWRFVAPIGPIEANEIRWYLEKYAVWPSGFFDERARKVEESLAAWGRLLHDAAMPVAETANVAQAGSRSTT